MSPRKRRAAVLDAEASIEEFEAAAAEAQARAYAARARADSLRVRVAEEDRVSVLDRIRGWSRPKWLRLPSLKPLALAEAVALIAVSGAAIVLMMVHHKQADQDRQLAAEYSAAARQSVITMMTIDPARVQQNMKDVIDNATGRFKSTLEAGEADVVVKGAQETKVTMSAVVQSAAVESMKDGSATVLVSASTEGTAPDNKKLPPASWRIRLTLVREHGQIKTSEFEFVR
jgi:Mce-associated membrane protein